MLLSNFFMTLLAFFSGSTATDIEEQITLEMFEERIEEIYTNTGLDTAELNYEVFQHAMIGYYNLKNDSMLNNSGIISIIDYTKKTNEKRFYTIDLENEEILFHTFVAHGMKSGDERETKSVSNVPFSNKSSQGFYITGETYYGVMGFSLRLDGMDEGFNDNVRERAIVMHKGRDLWVDGKPGIARTLGCPAIPAKYNDAVINTIKEGTMIFAFAGDEEFLRASANLNEEKALMSFAGA